MTSTSASLLKRSALLIESLNWSPPRLVARCARAWSTRILRISLLASPKNWARFCQLSFFCALSLKKASCTIAVDCRLLFRASRTRCLFARRRSSSYTSGINSSSADLSPSLHRTRSWVIPSGVSTNSPTVSASVLGSTAIKLWVDSITTNNPRKLLRFSGGRREQPAADCRQSDHRHFYH